MGNVISLFPAPTAYESILPTIFTDEVIAYLSLCNSASRALRSLGYQIIEEDPVPDDGGTPIIQIEPLHIRTSLLVRNSDCYVVNKTTGVHCVKYAGCRVIWIAGKTS